MDWEIGEKVIIRGGQHDEPGTVFSIRGTRGQVKYYDRGREDFVLKSGKVVGKDLVVVKATDSEHQAAIDAIDERARQKEIDDDAKRQAAYDALPESVKLARKVIWFCECNGEKAVAALPIEILRAVVRWAEEHGKEVE